MYSTVSVTGVEIQTRRALLIVILIGVVLRLALIAAGGPPERFEYDDLARNLISGRGYVYDQLGTPYRSFYAGLAYIALNATTDWLFPNSPKAMAVVQSLYAGVLALVVFQISRRFFDERLAVVAAALVLLHPSLLYYDTRKLHPLGFDALMMMTAVWLLLRLPEDRRVSMALLSGAVLGFAIFQRGSMALFLAGGLIWLLWASPSTARPEPVEGRASARGSTGSPRASAWTACIYLFGALLVITPWAARNYAIHHIVMLESMTPQQFWKGNASYSNGSGYLAGGRNVYDVAPERLVEEWKHLDETGQFRLFSEEGAAEVRKDPRRAAVLMLEKLAYFWTVPPNSGQQYPARYFIVYLAYYGVILLAAVVGLVTALGQPALRPGVILVLIYFASLTIVHAIMFVEMRHRWAAEPMMLAFVPGGARAIWSRWSR